ncbi:(2Fe-2S)-binding protein [candidate division KSB1 bacterium]|nr:(2Fe-2S)-binding protein [candidate division KSB1 bacterium]
MKFSTIKFELNGKPVEIEVPPAMRLLDILRETFKLTGTKEGCGIGECGACTVLLNGQAVASCLLLAGQLEGTKITTIEGLVHDERMNLLQRNFLECGAVQCGFCTPGMLLSAYALLQKDARPTTDDIKNAIAGNLCRCTGYKQIIQAIQKSTESLSDPDQ